MWSGFCLFVLKSENQSPVCVKTDSVTKLVLRGWAKLATENTPTGSGQSQSSKIVTLDQNNQVINLKKGEGFLLKLGENYQWSIDIGNQTVLSRVMNIMIINGAQGIFDAHNVGQTKLSATGDPLCRTETPLCGAPSILFRININVSP